MARRAFYSFHYKPDCQRAAQIRNMGVVDGNVPVSDNDWEAVTSGGDTAIKKWIEEQLAGRGCAVVLVGSGTAGRKWITYEIQRAWDLGKGVLGVHIHNLKDLNGSQSTKGANPFWYANHGTTSLGQIVSLHDPPYTDSKAVYDYIKTNLAGWADKAVEQRAAY